jgi:hypothetical protein
MFVLAAAYLLAGAPGSPTFTATLLVTNQPGTLFLRREQGQKLELASVENARREEPVAALILFAGCGSDKQGHCNVATDITVLDPAGKVYGESKGTEVWIGKPPPPAGGTELGVGYLMIRIEPKDPPGVYRVKAHIMDRVSGTMLDREHRFKVDPAKSADMPQWPAGQPKPELTGFWKDHCEDDFGLKIEPAGNDQYSISFCGPGGCFEPGTYRPNSPIFGDQRYRVIDANTIEVLGGDGFSTYYRCPGPAKK